MNLREQWDANALFVFISACLLNFPSAVAAYTGGQHIVIDAYGGGHVVYSSVIENLQAVCGVGVIALCMGLIGNALRRRQVLNAYAWPIVAACVISLLANLQVSSTFVSLNQATALVVLVACLLASPSRGTAVGAALFGAFYALGSGLLVLVNSTSAIAACTRKCSPTGVIMPGLNGSENAFGLCAALAMPFVYLGFRGFSKYAFTLFLGYLAIASGSRSALLGIAGLIAVVIVGWVSSPFLKRALIVGVVGGVVIVGFALPFLVDDPQAFSTRGRVWQLGIEYLSESPLIGRGANGWGSLLELGEISRSDAYSLHNVWLDTLFVSGWLGVILLAVSLILLMVARARTNSLFALLVILIPVLAVGVLERSVSIYSSNWLGWILPALLLYECRKWLPGGRDDLMGDSDRVPSYSGTKSLF